MATFLITAPAGSAAFVEQAYQPFNLSTLWPGAWVARPSDEAGFRAVLNGSGSDGKFVFVVRVDHNNTQLLGGISNPAAMQLIVEMGAAHIGDAFKAAG